MASSTFGAVLMLCLLMLHQASSSAKGRFHVQIIQYKNHDSLGSDGLYCDTVGFFNLWLNACDPIFTLKLDAFVHGGSGMLVFTTSSHENQDTVNFGSRFGSIGNPVSARVPAGFTGNVKFSMEVRDHDFDAHDHIDSFAAQLYAVSKSAAKELTLSHRGHSLSIKYWFVCDEYYYGDLCDRYCKPHNDNVNGHYVCDADGAKVCLTGWIKSSANCKELHPCSSSNTCKNKATCVTVGDTHRCICSSSDYSGTNCEIYTSPCLHRNPCLNDGVCFLGAGGEPECRCGAEFTGPLCQFDVNECLSSPCKNNQSCENTFGGFRCHCSDRFAGKLCELDVNECNATVNPCSNGGECRNIVGNFSCRCRAGWTGRLCDVDVNECWRDVCSNGSTCVNVNGSYHCLCATGYVGRHCSQHQCQSLTCSNGGHCNISANGSATCECPPGFTGASCEIDIDDCVGVTCLNGGRCIDARNDFECRCSDGFDGRRCERNIDDCQPNPCRHGGNCTDLVYNFTCACSQLYEGARCERKRPVIGGDGRAAAVIGGEQPPASAAAGGVVGGVVAAVCVLCLIVVLAVFLLRRRTQNSELEEASDNRSDAFPNPIYEQLDEVAAAGVGTKGVTAAATAAAADDDAPAPPLRLHESMIEEAENHAYNNGGYFEADEFGEQNAKENATTTADAADAAAAEAAAADAAAAAADAAAEAASESPYENASQLYSSGGSINEEMEDASNA